MVRDERALADRLKDRPVVLLGVNADEEPRKADEATRKEKVAWRSWADGKRNKIAAQWEVEPPSADTLHRRCPGRDPLPVRETRRGEHLRRRIREGLGQVLAEAKARAGIALSHPPSLDDH